jgi:hypothetical protein
MAAYLLWRHDQNHVFCKRAGPGPPVPLLKEQGGPTRFFSFKLEGESAGELHDAHVTISGNFAERR